MGSSWQEITVSRSQLFQDGDECGSDGSSDVLMSDLPKIDAIEEVVVQPGSPQLDGTQSDEELDFRLFSNSAAPIIVKSPSPGPEETSIARIALPAAHRLTPRRQASEPAVLEVSPADKQRFEAAAVSGADVITRSTWIWPGCASPSQVTRLVVSARLLRKLRSAATPKSASLSPQAVVAEPANGEPEKRRSKPGKKKRLVLRKREDLKRLAAEGDRQKRTLRNREKKIKRKMKEKAKKAEMGNGAIDGQVEIDSDGGRSVD